MRRANARIMCLILSLFAAAAVGAEEKDRSANTRFDDGAADEPKSYYWGLGIAGLGQQQAYTDIDRENVGIPLVYFENRWVHLFGPWLDIKLPGLEWSEEQELSFAIRTQLFGFHGYEPDDAPILDGMEERKNGVFAGPVAKWANPFADVFAEWMFDASGNSKRERATIGLEKSFHVSEHVMISPSISATWMDEKYVDYYYGVRDVEALADRPAYSADSTITADISLRADYMLGQHHSVFGMLQYTALGSEIEDSPLIDRSSESMVLFGYLYRF